MCVCISVHLFVIAECVKAVHHEILGRRDRMNLISESERACCEQDEEGHVWQSVRDELGRGTPQRVSNLHVYTDDCNTPATLVQLYHKHAETAVAKYPFTAVFTNK